MAAFQITGGEPLIGSIDIQGSKNASLPISVTLDGMFTSCKLSHPLKPEHSFRLHHNFSWHS